MTSRNLGMKLCSAALVTVAALGLGLSLAEPGKAADAEPASACPGAGKPDSRFMGASYCRRCHTNGEAFQFPSKLATLDEFPIWDKRDKHRHAFEALTGDRARQMESLLGMKPGAAATSRECTACHTTAVTADTAGPSLDDDAKRHAAIEQGVSCEACHGRASPWVDVHPKPGDWSNRKPPLLDQEKEEKYGMTNVRDPVRRTELCLSCHVGDIACGKFVTHDMFAAGHPPLPAFEIETFLQQMPPHWRPVPSQSRTRSVALEGLVALRASVRLLAAAARLPRQNDHADSASLDFAIYDCTACHHELRIPSPRQDRGYFGGAPGRPPMRAWNIPLATAAMEPLSSKGETPAPSPLDAALARLQSATSSRPFGDPQAVQAAARDVIEQLNQAIATVKERPFDGQGSRRLFEQICRVGAKSPLDYGSAWQLAGALRAIGTDIVHPGPGEAPTPLDPKIKLSVEELSALVHFPSPPDSSSTARANDSGTLWQNGENFKPEQFREKLGEIAKLLGSQ